jgi:hypothetical protein
MVTHLKGRIDRMQEITAYMSNDGKIFDSKHECSEHELIIKREKDLIKLKANITGYTDEAYGVFSNTKDLFEFLYFLNVQLKLMGYTLNSFVGIEGSDDYCWKAVVNKND